MEQPPLEINIPKPKLSVYQKARMARLALYVVYSHFGLPFGVTPVIKPSKEGWPHISFQNLPAPHLGIGKAIAADLLLLQSEKRAELTKETIELFHEVCVIAKSKIDPSSNFHPVFALRKLLPFLLGQLGTDNDRRIAKLVQAPVVYYAGRKIKNDHLSSFLASERKNDELLIVDLLTGRTYNSYDLLLPEEFAQLGSTNATQAQTTETPEAT